MTLQPNIEQLTALQVIQSWITSSSSPQVFALLGLAGTGKTQLIRFLLESQTFRAPHTHPLFLLSPTARAGIVLAQRTQIPVSTIHSALYGRPLTFRPTDEDPNSDPAQDQARSIFGSRVRTPQSGFLSWIYRPGCLENSRLLIVDESSMVGTKLATDLKRVGAKILAVGDPGQLPPVKDSPGLLPSTLTPETPGYMLHSIQRQAQGNPIISLAHQIRSGASLAQALQVWIDYNHIRLHRTPTYPDVLNYLPPYDGTASTYAPILCYAHRDRIALNALLFQAAAPYASISPLGPAHYAFPCRVMANRDAAANGEILFVPLFQKGKTLPKLLRKPHVVRSAGDPRNINVPHLDLSVLHHTIAAEHPPSRTVEKARTSPHTVPVDLGFALTIHAAQGSSWPTVVLRADPYLLHSRSLQARQLAYTAVTRASHHLIVLV